jgi:hypothetical protein
VVDEWGRTSEEHGRSKDHDNEGLGLLADSGELVQRTSVPKSEE